MKYLLYCVFKNPPGEGMRLAGVGGKPVFLVAKNGLGTAVSRVSSADLAPDICRILAYEEVIESIHRQRTVIPLRYGSVLERKSQIAGFLEKRGEQYEALLKELEGRVEMGIRVLFKDAERETPLPTAALSGAAYLAVTRDRYAREDRLTREQEMIVERIYCLFSGLFARSKAAASFVAGRRSLSLHFLVPNHCVELFRKAFLRLAAEPSARLLLSGPWPPHNFVY